MKSLSLVALAATLPCACSSSGNGPLMSPGEDCLSCHGSTSINYTAAGTVYPDADAAADQGLEGVTVRIVDSNDRTVALVSNAAGNFYTAESLERPFSTAVEKDGVRIEASGSITGGACNGCHTVPPLGGATGRLFWFNSGE